MINSDVHSKVKLPKLDLLEVMYSSESELVKQTTLMRGRAKRFGLAEGDLQTRSGRRRLFSMLVSQDPKSVWYSPECGPWSRLECSEYVKISSRLT